MVLMLQNLSFSEAEKYFQKFLIQQNLSNEILWLFREDAISYSDHLVVRMPRPKDNERLAQNCFEVGRKRNLGVCFSAIAALDQYSCC